MSNPCQETISLFDKAKLKAPLNFWGKEDTDEITSYFYIFSEDIFLTISFIKPEKGIAINRIEYSENLRKNKSNEILSAKTHRPIKIWASYSFFGEVMNDTPCSYDEFGMAVTEEKDPRGLLEKVLEFKKFLMLVIEPPALKFIKGCQNE